MKYRLYFWFFGVPATRKPSPFNVLDFTTLEGVELFIADAKPFWLAYCVLAVDPATPVTALPPTGTKVIYPNKFKPC